MDHAFLLIIVFFVVSTFFSMVGIGGGILYVPILLFAGFSMKQAPAISLILIVATSVSALLTYWHNHKVDWKLALVIDVPTDIMAFVGGYFSWAFSEVVLKAMLAGVLVVAGIMMMGGNTHRAALVDAPKRRWCWHRTFNGVEYFVNMPLVFAVAVFIGTISGMIGVTGGVVKLPVMVLLCGVPMDVAVATSTAMVAVTAAFGLAGHAVHGAIQWRMGLFLALAAIAGGILGSNISITMDKRRLKRLFGVVLVLVALRLVAQLLL